MRTHSTTLFHVLAVGCRWLLALVFLAAALPKLFTMETFAANVGAYGIVPDAMVTPVAITIVLLEIVAGVGLLLKRQGALWLSSALMLIFIGVLSYGIWLGLDINCGCFNSTDGQMGGSSSLWTALVRDIVLMVPLTYLFFYPFLTSKFTRGVS